MKNIIFIVLYFLTLPNLFSQGNSQEYNLRPYFFPYKELSLQNSKYTFVNVSDSSEKYFWHIQTKIQRGDTLLLTQVRDSQNRLTEEVWQKVGKNSILMQSYKIYDYKESEVKKRDCQVLDSAIFNWHQSPEDSATWNVSYYDTAYNKTFELKKSRIFKKIDNSQNLAKFTDFYYVKIGSTQLLDHEVISYFKLNQGLFKYTILYRNGVTKLFTLFSESKE
jgi:hypothetical protein